MDLGRRESVRQIEQRRVARRCPLLVHAVTARAVRRVQLLAARRRRRRSTRHQTHYPRHLVRVDVQHRRLGIEGRAAPFRPAVQAGEHDRALQARRDELTAAPHRSESLQHRAMCLRRTIGEHVLGQSLARERLGYERERLRIGGHLTLDVRRRVPPVLDRKEQLAGFALEHEHVARLGDLRDRVDPATVAAQAHQIRGRRQVSIPNVVPDELKMPHAFAGLRFEREERVGEQVVPHAIGTVVVVGRRARGHEHEAALHVERHPGPVVRGAGIRPRALRPCVVPELPGPRNGVEGPAQRPGSHIIGPHVARRRREALGRAAPEDEQVFVDDTGRPQ